MKVRARSYDPNNLPKKIRSFINQVNITENKLYEVYAIAVHEDGLPFFLFIDDENWPSWMPCMLFNITDNSIPNDWICSFNVRDSSHHVFLIGPEFIAKNDDSYCAMIETEVEKMKILKDMIK